MIKTSWKKSLIAAGILTALCASAAFAAEVPAQTEQTPSMRARVHSLFGHDGSGSGSHRFSNRDGGRHWQDNEGCRWQGEMTEEQRIEYEKLRANWEKMSPEERREAKQKWRENHLKNMTPEEQERFKQHEKLREEWQNMTPEERTAAHRKWNSDHGKNKGHYYKGNRKNHQQYSAHDEQGGFHGDSTDYDYENLPG